MVQRRPINLAGANAGAAVQPLPRRSQEVVQTPHFASSGLDLERQYNLIQGQLVQDMRCLSNVLNRAAAMIKAGDMPRADGECGELGRVIDLNCKLLCWLDKHIVRHK